MTIFAFVLRSEWSCQNSKQGPPNVGQSVLQANRRTSSSPNSLQWHCVSPALTVPQGGCKYDGFYGPSQQPAVHFLLSNFPFSIFVTSAVTLFLLTPPRPLFPCLALFAIVYLHPNSSLLGEYGLSLLKPAK